MARQLVPASDNAPRRGCLVHQISEVCTPRPELTFRRLAFTNFVRGADGERKTEQVNERGSA